MRCDVAIGAIRGKNRAPVLVSEAMVEQMKDGALIVDVSIDRGGCFETSKVTTHSKPTFNAHGVTHYCVPNIPSRYARTASLSISNIFTPSRRTWDNKISIYTVFTSDITMFWYKIFFHLIIILFIFTFI